MRREGQAWISDSLVASLGFDLVFPDAYIGWLEQGMKLQDYRRTMARVRSMAMMAKAWRVTGDDLREKGEAAEKRGHEVTAGEFYHRAAFCYLKSFWGKRDPDVLTKLRISYEKAAARAPYPVRRVEIPFGDATVFGILHLPETASADAPVPVVIFTPGMDMVKEDFPNLQNNAYVRRGMACLSIDGPGQGETWLNGLYVDPDNYAAAGSAVIDFIEQQPELNADKIGVAGVSMGSYWAPTIAARDSRIKACGVAMGNFLDKHVIFDLAPPAFRRNFMEMSGHTDDDSFDAMVEGMTLERWADDIACPTLLAHGEFDQLCPLSDARDFFAMLSCPKELWIFENEFHGLGRQRGEMFTMIADWLNDRLAGLPVAADGEETWFAEPN